VKVETKPADSTTVAAASPSGGSTSAATTSGTSGSTTSATSPSAKVAAPKAKTESKAPKASYGDEPKYWKSGTGYGHGDQKSSWDPEAQKLLLVHTRAIPYAHIDC
jgi:hypothetical protein